MNRLLLAASLVVALLLAGCDATAAGAKAYDSGRFDEAHRLFGAAADASGEGASAELLHDRALAALRHGDLADAEASAQRAAARGGAEIARRSGFLRGNVAFARCRAAGLQAAAPEAEPFAFDLAIRYGEAARDAWQTAAMSRPDWPEARRNVERALLEIEDLQRRKAEAESRRQKKHERQPQPKPAPAKQERRPVAQEAPLAGPQNTELPADQVMRVLDRLADRERAKLDLRRARRAQQPADVERDW